MPWDLIGRPAQVITDGARGTGISGLLGNLGVGQDLARPRVAQDGANRVLELRHRGSVFGDSAHVPHTARMLNELLEANARYAASFAGGHLQPEPARGLVVVTCMDARIDAADVLGLAPGDAHILRNAGGRVSDDVIRSLVVSTCILGTRTIVVMHHTGCGMTTVTKREITAILGDSAEAHLETFDLRAIEDQERALREDVEAVRESPLLPDVDVFGLLYDVTTGVAQHVV